MIAEPYICIKGERMGEILWIGDYMVDVMGSYPPPDEWRPYADFEREKLRQLRTRGWYVSGYHGYVWHNGEYGHALNSTELLAYPIQAYEADTESNRLLKRSEFLKAVCEKEGVEWLPEKKSQDQPIHEWKRCGCNEQARIFCKDHLPYSESQLDSIEAKLDSLLRHFS